MLVCLSWIILDECIKEWRILIQLCTYLKIHHIYIWKPKLMQTFVHKYGTCSRASALGNKNTQTRPRIAQKWNTNVLSWGLLKHSKYKIVNTHEKAIFRPGISSLYTVQRAEPSFTGSIFLDAQRSKDAPAFVRPDLPNNRILASCSW